mmetsp:Transcript_37283/g.55786  ORF Transcript_37283/g.55786 Transcript_37283/m.55786 type:complete len:80 (-) Transcript_37283:415-654(-)
MHRSKGGKAKETPTCVFHSSLTFEKERRKEKQLKRFSTYVSLSFAAFFVAYDMAVVFPMTALSLNTVLIKCIHFVMITK